jgi:hypothetical protein
MNNTKQVTMALHVYATDYKDKLPSWGNIGNWAWDLPWAVGTTLEANGIKYLSLYCPGTRPRFTDQDNWNLYNYDTNQPGAFHVLGYAMTFAGEASLNPTNYNVSLNPDSITNAAGIELYGPPPISTRVFVAEATISAPGENNPASVASYNWTDIVGGYTKHHTTPHMKGPIPAGGNLGMLDGHAEWRRFQLMLPRDQDGSGAPVFWW